MISDTILDSILAQDKFARVACEASICKNTLLIMGEITSNATVDYANIAKDVIRKIGYDSTSGFDVDKCQIIISMSKQSPDIAMGVDTGGAGDQGMMFGYACDETEELMPLPITLAHALTDKLEKTRVSGEIKWLRPDGKSQVTVEYNDGVPTKVDTVVVSTQHTAETDIEIVRAEVLEKIIKAVIPAELMNKDTKIYINPTGRFVVGGPEGDSGLTGRKIIVDTYGGYCAHGGGAFSGKDPSKVDRSATYMARYICKNVVAAGLAKQCEIEVAYAIGRAQPVSLLVNTYGTGKVSDEELAGIINKVFDLRPAAIIEQLKLLAPQYAQTARNGHFGKPAFNWEKTDKVKELKACSV